MRMSSAEKRRTKRLVYVFDFGGVVIKWKNNNPIYDYIADRYVVPRAKLRRVLDLTLPRLESGDISTREFLTSGLARFGKRLRKGDAPEELWTLPFARLAKLRIGTIKIVRSLRKDGYRVFLFSNTSFPHARLMRRMHWDGLFDGLLTSCELRSCKPAPTAFRRALAKIGANPSEVVFIDDKEENVRGAKEFGIGWAIRFTSVARLKRDIAKLTPSRTA
jgi:putative hydrolase of the HAD superfamily